MEIKKNPELKQLNPDVAKKYSCPENFLYDGKLVFPKGAIHGVANKPAHELTVAEVDALVEAGAVKGIFTLKNAPAEVAAKPESTKKS